MGGVDTEGLVRPRLGLKHRSENGLENVGDPSALVTMQQVVLPMLVAEAVARGRYLLGAVGLEKLLLLFVGHVEGDEGSGAAPLLVPLFRRAVDLAEGSIRFCPEGVE